MIGRYLENILGEMYWSFVDGGVFAGVLERNEVIVTLIFSFALFHDFQPTKVQVGSLYVSKFQ
jgi:hypothetical protein